jgi:hypothetical protein
MQLVQSSKARARPGARTRAGPRQIWRGPCSSCLPMVQSAKSMPVFSFPLISLSSSTTCDVILVKVVLCTESVTCACVVPVNRTPEALMLTSMPYDSVEY